MTYLSDDDRRILAYLEWRKENETNIDARIALEQIIEDLRAGKHRGDD